MAQNVMALKSREMQKGRGLGELVSLFVKSYLSLNTKAAYAKDIELFFAYCMERGGRFRHPKEIGSEHLQAYRDYLLQELKQANNTVIRKMVSLRALMRWCVHEGVIERNPLLNVRLPKAKLVMTTLDFSDDEVKSILKQPDVATPSGVLHHLVLLLLFYLGLRKSEAVGIKIKDFYEERNHFALRIYGKGEKYRNIALTPAVRRAIENYKCSVSVIDPMSFINICWEQVEWKKDYLADRATKFGNSIE